MSWLPIVTAPKGKAVLLWNGDTLTLGLYHTHGAWAGNWVDFCEAGPGALFLDPEPTHWMPLPMPPEAP